MMRRRWLCERCKRLFVPYRGQGGRVRCTYCLKLVNEDGSPEREDAPRIIVDMRGIGNKP